MSAGNPARREGTRVPDAEERELLARIRAGDAAAFERLFRQHYEGMCSLAYMLIRSRDAAEDIVANVFRTLWKRRFDWDPSGSARSYLLTATRNEAASWVRQLRRQAGIEQRAGREDTIPALGAPTAAPDDALTAREIHAAIEQASAALPAQCRAVFQLRWTEGLKHREIAERMGLSLKTVEMHMTRALRAIRERLQPHR